VLVEVYDTLQHVPDARENAARRDEFVFHMMDWIDDMERLRALYRSPVRDATSASEVVVGFLYHVVPHLNAAGRLLLDEIPDRFAKR
jgi:hypothetical protein